jgi:hypothetical protein
MRQRGPHSPATRERIRQSLVRHWSDIEVRVRHGAFIRFRMAAPEVRAKISTRTKMALAARREKGALS